MAGLGLGRLGRGRLGHWAGAGWAGARWAGASCAGEDFKSSTEKEQMGPSLRAPQLSRFYFVVMIASYWLLEKVLAGCSTLLRTKILSDMGKRPFNVLARSHAY